MIRHGMEKSTPQYYWEEKKLIITQSDWTTTIKSI